MTLINKIPPDELSYTVLFLEGIDAEPFITASFPFGLTSASLDYIYMPLSKTVAIELKKVSVDYLKSNQCKKTKLKQFEIEYYNSLLLSKDSFLICDSEKPLRKYIEMMENEDGEKDNPYVLSHLRMMSSLPSELFLDLITHYIDEELRKNNPQYQEIMDELLSRGMKPEDAKRKMAEAIEEEFRSEVFSKTPVDELKLYEEMQKNL